MQGVNKVRELDKKVRHPFITVIRVLLVAEIAHN